jgi:CheY-like chemotaxis protein
MWADALDDPKGSEADPAAAAAAGERILLVEDDAAMRSFLCDVLRREGYRVTTAENGIEALRCLWLDTFFDEACALVITDHRMPGLTGIELTGHLHRLDPSPPVLVLSAFADDALEEAAYRAGASAVLAKPFGLQPFVEIVRALATED